MYCLPNNDIMWYQTTTESHFSMPHHKQCVMHLLNSCSSNRNACVAKKKLLKNSDDLTFLAFCCFFLNTGFLVTFCLFYTKAKLHKCC